MGPSCRGVATELLTVLRIQLPNLPRLPSGCTSVCLTLQLCSWEAYRLRHGLVGTKV